MTLRDGIESHTVRPDTRGFWYADELIAIVNTLEQSAF
jgi:hypothetical protein